MWIQEAFTSVPVGTLFAEPGTVCYLCIQKGYSGTQLKGDVYKRLNRLSPPSAHLSLLTLKRNLGICPSCKHLHHKILELGKRNLNVQPVTSLSFYFQAAIISNRKIEVNIKQHGKAFLKLSLAIKCIDAK